MEQTDQKNIITYQNIKAIRTRENSIAFSLFSLFLSICFFVAVPIAAHLTGVKGIVFWQNLLDIFTGPSKLVTDYFSLGCLASTFFNAGICGIACNIMIFFSQTKAKASTLAAYLLVIAHCFYGLNFVNMWPPFIGVVVYCITTKRPIRKNLTVAMFSTALAPFISDFIFFYPLGNSTRVGNVSIVGIILSLAFGIISGFLIPALLEGTYSMHKGFNMYGAGLAIGLMGIFVYCFLYRTLGIEPHNTTFNPNDSYLESGSLYYVFMNVFFSVIFLIALILGFCLNGWSFRNYKKLLSCSGYGLDFSDKFGMPLCFINFGVYGFCILLYLNAIFFLPNLLPFLPDGVVFTGPTAGIVFAALTFSADGQHPRNVAPIALGYTILFFIVCIVCSLFNIDIPWTLSTQAYINGLAFATGLCPIAGVYGFKYGVIAGLVSAIICTSTSSMHGGFVLYNGGFNAGLTALLLVPVLEFYKVKPKHDADTDEAFEISHTSKTKSFHFVRKKK